MPGDEVDAGVNFDDPRTDKMDVLAALNALSSTRKAMEGELMIDSNV